MWVDGTVDGHENMGKWKNQDQNLRYTVKVEWYDWVPFVVGTVALVM